jgi:hypothetical protein
MTKPAARPLQTVLGFALCLAVIAPALAADQATGWKAWSDHAQRVLDAAAAADDGGSLGPACKGTTSTIISQGFQFPYWAQMLPQFCGVVQKATSDSMSRRELGSHCKDLRRVKGELSKAKPVAVAPRASEQAAEMVEVLKLIEDRQCS